MGIIVFYAQGGQLGHWGCLEKRWELSSKDGLHELQQGFPEMVTMPYRWL